MISFACWRRTVVEQIWRSQQLTLGACQLVDRAGTPAASSNFYGIDAGTPKEALSSLAYAAFCPGYPARGSRRLVWAIRNATVLGPLVASLGR